MQIWYAQYRIDILHFIRKKETISLIIHFMRRCRLYIMAHLFAPYLSDEEVLLAPLMMCIIHATLYINRPHIIHPIECRNPT